MGIVPPGRLVYGMQLPIQSQSTLYAERWEAGARSEELARVVRQADRTGFFYVAVCDHVAIPRPLDEKMGATWYDTVATMGWIAALTERVRILSHVFVPAYRHPLVAAKSFMTLDELSAGRLVIGVGTGHVEGEFGLLGADFAERGPVTDEAIDVIRAAMSSAHPEVVTSRWSVRDAAMAPRPRQSRVPIWVGGSSRPALRRAAVRGDGWLPQGTPRAQMPEQISYLLRCREDAGIEEPPDLGVVTEILYVGDAAWELRPTDLHGHPEHLAGRLRELGGMGVNHMQIRFRSRSVEELLDQMESFSTQVAPLLDG